MSVYFFWGQEEYNIELEIECIKKNEKVPSNTYGRLQTRGLSIKDIYQMLAEGENVIKS